MSNDQLSAARFPKAIKSLIQSHFDLAEIGSMGLQPKLIAEAQELPDGMIIVSEADIVFNNAGLTISGFMTISWDSIAGYHADCDRLEIRLVSGKLVKFETAIA